MTPPDCDETTGAPGEQALELMLVVTAGVPGALIEGVAVEYDAMGHPYETEIPATLTLCGTQVRDADCWTLELSGGDVVGRPPRE